ncbi:MAG: hypothetical protein HPY85_11905 [Anaerolineae bacterium]|nr:hypothetical protein [Anaerolineae bacterium]
MKLLEKLSPWLAGMIIGILAGIVLWLLLQSAVMGFVLGAGIAVMARNILHERRRRNPWQ